MAILERMFLNNISVFKAIHFYYIPYVQHNKATKCLRQKDIFRNPSVGSKKYD